MPLNLYPVCWRGRSDCEPIHCIDSAPEGTTEEQVINFDYKPTSFVCSGRVTESNRTVKQDAYRLCFKNHCCDDISDNDLHDLTSVMAVVSAALNYDAIMKVNNGIVELPAANGTFDNHSPEYIGQHNCAGESNVEISIQDERTDP